MLPLRLLDQRVFVGGNLVWLLACLTSSGALFFVAVSLQTTLGYRPLVAGLALLPLYLVMTVGSPLSGRLADRIGPRLPALAGLVIYSAGLWLLSGIGPGSELAADVLPGLLVVVCGTALFGPPLTTATLGALDDADQGIASGANNAVGQLGGCWRSRSCRPRPASATRWSAGRRSRPATPRPCGSPPASRRPRPSWRPPPSSGINRRLSIGMAIPATLEVPPASIVRAN